MPTKILDILTRLLLILFVAVMFHSPAQATPPNTILGSVALCDPNSPQTCTAPNSDGSVTTADNPYPFGATPVTSSSGNVANANAVATLPAVAAKTNYLTSFQLTSGGATAAGCFTATITGVIGGTMSYTYCVPAGATVPPASPLDIAFYPALQASAVNTAIVVTLPALGAGNTNATANAQGYVR